MLGSVVLVDIGDSPRPAEVGDALLALHGEAETVLARHGISGEHREPSVKVIAGDGDTETVHTEHGTRYAMDLAEVMFSPGNEAERARMGEIVSEGRGTRPSERASGEAASEGGERVLICSPASALRRPGPAPARTSPPSSAIPRRFAFWSRTSR